MYNSRLTNIYEQNFHVGTVWFGQITHFWILNIDFFFFSNLFRYGRNFARAFLISKRRDAEINFECFYKYIIANNPSVIQGTKSKYLGCIYT